MKYKLIAADVDGTLLDSNKKLTDVTKKTIHEAVKQGVIFAISSGRPVQAAFYFSNLLELPDMPFILYNGAVVVVGPEHEIIFNQGLSGEDARRLIHLGLELGTTLIVWSKDRLYVSEFNERVEIYKKITPMEPILLDDPETVIRDGIIKMIWFDELERIPFLTKRLQSDAVYSHINSFTSNPRFLELVDKKCSKALALQKLAEYYGIQREEIIAIGDGYNDLPMLLSAGFGIAMANAPEEIRQQAGDVTLSNDEDGVAAAIRKHILS